MTEGDQETGEPGSEEPLLGWERPVPVDRSRFRLPGVERAYRLQMRQAP